MTADTILTAFLGFLTVAVLVAFAATKVRVLPIPSLWCWLAWAQVSCVSAWDPMPLR